MTRHSRDDVVAAAGRLFAQRGYNGTSMRDLGRELGVLGSSLYSHVEGKHELLVAVVDQGALLFQASAERALAVDGTSADRLEAFIAGHIDVVLDHLDIARTFLNEARSLEPAYRRPIVEARDRYERALRRILREGSADGSFRTDLDPMLSGIFILSILNAVDRWYRPDGALDRAALVNAVAAFVDTGLR